MTFFFRAMGRVQGVGYRAFVESLDWEPLIEGESLPTSFEIRS